MPFSTLFQFLAAANAPLHAFLELLFTSTQHNIHSKPQATCYFPTLTIVEIMVKGETGINPAAVTVDRSNQRPCVLMSSVLLTEQKRLATLYPKNHLDRHHEWL